MAARRDRGEATAQLVVITPILLLLVLMGVQAAIFFHAANVASAAAAEGAAAGSTDGADAAAAEAQRALSELGAAGRVAAALDDGRVTVSVEVIVPQLVPFFPDSVRRISVEPIESFVPESER